MCGAKKGVRNMKTGVFPNYQLQKKKKNNNNNNNNDRLIFTGLI
jgi:hypothetical protein